MHRFAAGTSQRFVRWGALGLSILLLVGVGAQLRRSQSQGEQELLDRFRIRSEISAKYLASYAKDLLASEIIAGSLELGSTDVSEQQFTRLCRILRFPAAVLLDSTGRILAIEPPSAALLGRNISGAYVHLDAALAGRISVSNVVPSAAHSVPVVGFAVPIDTEQGRRVFSGALSIADQTLGSNYLNNIIPLPGARVYLVDGSGATIASSLPGPQTTDLMQKRDRPLHDVFASAAEGRYTRFGKAEHFAVAAVAGTPWRLVISAPETELLAVVAGPTLWTSWFIFTALCLSLATAIVQSRRLANSRANELAEVQRLSITDTLTGLHNRRGHELLGAQVLRLARREKKVVAVLFVDLNGLKQVNDKRGHDAGDRMLVRTADLFRRTFRDSDVIARLGGDEFCIVGAVPGPVADVDSFSARLLENLAFDNAAVAEGDALSLSLGLSWCDTHNPRTLDAIVQEADARMYEQKRKNRLLAHTPNATRETTTPT